MDKGQKRCLKVTGEAGQQAIELQRLYSKLVRCTAKNQCPKFETHITGEGIDRHSKCERASEKMYAHTATKIPFMYSFSGNCAASVPISIFMCL